MGSGSRRQRPEPSDLQIGSIEDMLEADALRKNLRERIDFLLRHLRLMFKRGEAVLQICELIGARIVRALEIHQARGHDGAIERQHNCRSDRKPRCDASGGRIRRCGLHAAARLRDRVPPSPQLAAALPSRASSLRITRSGAGRRIDRERHHRDCMLELAQLGLAFARIRRDARAGSRISSGSSRSSAASGSSALSSS